jgi:hypothetical protein
LNEVSTRVPSGETAIIALSWAAPVAGGRTVCCVGSAVSATAR